jgi:hypothetical protein
LWKSLLNVVEGALLISESLTFPSPMPALFEVGDFGVVFRGSVMALMEIKRSAYLSGEDLAPRLDAQEAARFVADDPPGWVPTVDKTLYPDDKVLGVICVRMSHQRPNPELRKLISEGRCLVLMEERDSELVADAEAACRLINFLVRARQRAASACLAPEAAARARPQAQRPSRRRRGRR